MQVVPPNLSAVADFCLFTSNGNFTNTTGNTTVTGNVGTNLGLITAFPPGILNGVKHINNNTSLLASISLNTAYSQCEQQMCGNSRPASLGGLTLTSNIHCVSGNANLNGNLTFNAQGDPKAVFIIKINGNLSVGNNSKIILLNGASACNIYFQINGSVTVGINAIIRGNLLCNGAINLSSGAVVYGRILTKIGAISLSDNLVSITVPVSANISGDFEICVGASTTLTGSGGASYLWSTGKITQSINVSAGGNFSVIVTGHIGCSASAIATVQVKSNPIPSITADGSINFCLGDSVTLTASSGSSWRWSTGEITQSITVKKSADIDVSVTNQNGCTNKSSTVSIKVDSIPVIMASGSLAICTGDSITLTANSGKSFLWCTGETTKSITVLRGGKFYVSAEYNEGCQLLSDTISIGVNPAPLAQITVNGSLNFCEGDSVVLTASAGNSCLWSTGETASSISVKIPGSVNVAVTNSVGCTGISADIDVNVILSTVDLGPDTTTCGLCVELDAGNPGSSFLWCNEMEYQKITTCFSGIYFVEVSTLDGCVFNDTINVTINPAPIVNLGADIILESGKTVTLDAGISGAIYLWNTGQTTQSIAVYLPGEYWVEVTNNFGCIGIGKIKVIISTGFETIETDKELLVYPNPNNRRFTVSFVSEEKEHLEIKVLNGLGETVYTRDIPNFKGIIKEQVDLSKFPAGIYFVNVMEGNRTKNVKVSTY